MRRPLLVVTTLVPGIFLGLLTYLDDNAFATLFIGMVFVSLLVHTFGIGVNLVSLVSSSLEPVTAKASKMEIIARASMLTGTEKFICLLNDEEAACTRASLAMAGFSWIVAVVAAVFIAFAHDINVVSLVFAALAACPTVIYFAYGVEKQVRRCKPEEREKAMVNLIVDLLFAVAGCATIDLSIIRWQELGTAKPRPVDKSLFQFAMKQVSSTTTRSTIASTTTCRTTSTTTGQKSGRITVTV